MNIHSLALAVVLAMNSSMAFAQSSGMGISVLPPGAQTKPKAEESTTTGSATRTENPTNELKDNRVKKTTGNPGIQSGPVNK
jgi:hypothetical protein